MESEVYTAEVDDNFGDDEEIEEDKCIEVSFGLLEDILIVSSLSSKPSWTVWHISLVEDLDESGSKW